MIQLTVRCMSNNIIRRNLEKCGVLSSRYIRITEIFENSTNQFYFYFLFLVLFYYNYNFYYFIYSFFFNCNCFWLFFQFYYYYHYYYFPCLSCLVFDMYLNCSHMFYQISIFHLILLYFSLSISVSF